MDNGKDTRTRLESLRIRREHRPSADLGRRRRWGRRVLALLVVAIAVAAWQQRQRLADEYARRAAPVPAALLTVSARPEPEPPPVLTATGKIVSDHKVAVSTKVSGQIVSLHFEQGDHVKAGQVLARVEDVIYRARRDEAAARLARAQATLEFGKFNHERISGLFKGSSAPKTEFADAVRGLREAEAQVAAETAALAYAQKALDDCQVTAPIAGVVLERNVEVGDFVAAEGGRGAMANAQFALIADTEKLRVEVDISELDIARIKPEMPCLVLPEAYKDRRYEGKVMWLDPHANYSKATVQAKVRILQPDASLRVEGSAQVQFLTAPPRRATASAPAGLWLPVSACLSNAAEPSKAGILLVEGGRVRWGQVTLGRRIGDTVQVVDGLSESQQIVSAALDKYTEGQRVKPQ